MLKTIGENMTIGQKVKKARKIFAWVMVYAPHDGEYIEVKKSHVREILMKQSGTIDDQVFKYDHDFNFLYIN
jgi:hypothetical protein